MPPFRLTPALETRALPADRLGNPGMRTALGDVRKAGEKDRFHPVIHVGLENEFVPVIPSGTFAGMRVAARTTNVQNPVKPLVRSFMSLVSTR